MRLDRSGFRDTIKGKEAVEVYQAKDANALSWRFSSGLFKGHQIITVPTQYLIKLRHTTPSLDIAKRCTEEIDRRKRLSK